MDEPARKRRRTNSPQEERDRQSSPLRKPPRRPSFASPTKASLARNYPDLLRPTSAGPASRLSSRGDVLSRGKQARAFVLGETDAQPQDLPVDDAAREAAIASAERRASAQNTTPRARRVGPRAAPATTGALDEDEPELPPTPSQRGFEEQDGPRRGVLFSSPSKRPPRMKDPVKQSPLRPKAQPTRTLDFTTAVENLDENDTTQVLPQKSQPPDPEIEKRKQEKGRLQRELELLEAQVSRCTDEIAREQQRAPDQVLQGTERNELIDFLAKISGGDTEEEEQPAPVTSLLCSFLPFSAIRIPQPRAKQPEKPIASHRPVELTDPLPYLEMFTSFKFSSQLSLPRGKVFPSSNRVQQKHTVDIVGPQKLLSARISILLDALKHEIIGLQILRLSPWAERELGTFMRSKATERDLGSVCWAMESYWTIAVKRARYWHKCEQAFAHLIAGFANEDTENTRVHQTKSPQSMSRKDLNRHLGRDVLVLQDKHVLLKLNWRISFDWTGEAESEINVDTAFPSVWSETDTAANLKKIPDTFTSLLRSKGVFEATRIMAALLFAQ